MNARFFLRSRLGVLLALAVLVALPLAAACGDDDDDGGDNGDGGNGQLIAGISALDNSGLHDIDDEITNGEIPADARTVALHMQAVTKLTQWPDNMQATADKLYEELGKLAVELDKDNPDLPTATKLSQDAHAAWHDLSKGVWAHLQEEAGVASTAHGTESGGHQ